MKFLNLILMFSFIYAASILVWAESKIKAKDGPAHNHAESKKGASLKNAQSHNETSADEHAHDHAEEGKEEEHDEHHEDADEHKDGSHNEHDEESGGSVGPEKGILAANKDSGIQLSPAVVRNFEIKTEKVNGKGPWTLPATSILLSAEEVNLYRLRGGFFKRIDFFKVNRTKSHITVSSKELESGDEVVTGGIGFLRIAELAAFGGAPSGHIH